jgi:hypothetical protein
MKNLLLVIALIAVGATTVSAGECADGQCLLRKSRVVNVTKEIVSVPAVVTKRTVETVRNSCRGAVTKVRNTCRCATSRVRNICR